MIYFQNRDSKKNVGKTSGKRFVAAFEIKSYVLREDGSRELLKDDATIDLLTFLKDRDQELYAYMDEKSIVW